MKLYDCIVIGGGIVGTAILDRLARYNAAVLLLEKENDVAMGATKANSAMRTTKRNFPNFIVLSNPITPYIFRKMFFPP